MQLSTLEAVSREIYLAQRWRNPLGLNSCTIFRIFLKQIATGEKKFSQHKHCTQKLALVQTWYNCASFESFIFRKLSQKSLPICLQNLKFFICRPLKNPNVKGYYVFHRNISISCKNDGGFHLYLSKLAFSNQF